MILIRAILGMVFALALIALAVLNREPVALIWAPFFDPVTFPLYAVILSAVLFGFFWGGLAVFLSHTKIRSERRAQKKELRRLEKELQALQKTEIPGFISPP